MTTPGITFWRKPHFEEWVMNAEIGAYQAEDEERRDEPSFDRGVSGQRAETRRIAIESA